MSRCMCAGVVFSAIVCAVVLAVSFPQRAFGQTKPAVAAAPVKGVVTQSLADLIKIIKTDSDPSVVLRSYTRACAINRMDPELNSVYMRRMLLLGRPSAAYMSARILSAQDADAGLAWAVIGYSMGRANKYSDALTATARALEFDSDDTSIMNNAGQLAAWFDNVPAPPRLGDREKRIMDKLKAKFAKSQVYTDAYNRVNSVYADCKAQRADLQGKLTTAETTYNKTRTEELTMRASIARINSQIIQQNRKMKQLEKDIRRNSNKLNVVDELGRYVYNRRHILAENTRLQNALSAAEAKKNELIKEGSPLMPKIRIASAIGMKLRKDISANRRSLKAIRPAILRQLRWDPPSVNGVFTAENANRPRKIKPRTTTRPTTRVAVSGSEVEAANKLKMAKLYISNNKNQVARKVILEIFAKHPNTKAAAEARVLLKTISAETTP